MRRESARPRPRRRCPPEVTGDARVLTPRVTELTGTAAKRLPRVRHGLSWLRQRRGLDTPAVTDRFTMRRDGPMLAVFTAVFLLLLPRHIDYVIPAGPFLEAIELAHWYAEEHVVLCLLPAFFIAGAVAVFVRQAAIVDLLGSRANKAVAYGVASVSGTMLSVCSCTVLPLFAGIYRNGAGVGPATAFLYSGPAINVLAIVLTAQVLGARIGAARGFGAVAFSVVIGLLMAAIFRRREHRRALAQLQTSTPAAAPGRSLWQNGLFFASLVAILVFANWIGNPDEQGVWHQIYHFKWYLVGLSALALGVMLMRWFGLPFRRALTVGVPVAVLAVVLPTHPSIPFGIGIVLFSVAIGMDRGELGEWFSATWSFARMILPLLLLGVLAAGLLLGRPDHEGLIPSWWIASAVGGNGPGANAFAAIAGAFMYFATLTEIPILQGLLGSGMGQGPALALLLAGPALSLPNMLVIHRVLGTKQTLAYLLLVVVMATATGLGYGLLTS